METKEKKCEVCDGKGWLRVRERVGDGSGMLADIGDEPCPNCN